MTEDEAVEGAFVPKTHDYDGTPAGYWTTTVDRDAGLLVVRGVDAARLDAINASVRRWWKP